MQCVQCFLHWINPPLSFWPHEWTPFHHHCFEPRPTSCHPHPIIPDSFSRLLVCWHHTQTTWFHHRPHSLPVWNRIPTCSPITSHSRPKHPLTPHFHPCPSGTYSLLSVLTILLQRKNTVFCSKASLIPYFWFHLNVSTTVTYGPDDANKSVLGKCSSIPASIFLWYFIS